METEMQELYEAQHRVMPSPVIEDLVENSVFAVKHPDDLRWYRCRTSCFSLKLLRPNMQEFELIKFFFCFRVSIVTTLHGMVSVRYCDYGELGLVTLDRLRFLDARFMKIPKLAIRAKLHGKL
jgi:hypothetical protein